MRKTLRKLGSNNSHNMHVTKKRNDSQADIPHYTLSTQDKTPHSARRGRTEDTSYSSSPSPNSPCLRSASSSSSPLPTPCSSQALQRSSHPLHSHSTRQLATTESIAGATPPQSHSSHFATLSCFPLSPLAKTSLFLTLSAHPNSATPTRSSFPRRL